MDLIRAQTDLALRSATEQLEGRLGAQVKTLRENVIEILAHIEAAIEFPEEGIAPDVGEKLKTRFDFLREKIRALLATADQGRILREGVRVVIYGATNAGKSSLLNRLLGYDRAIVSEIPGTTRDTIEEKMNLRGVPIRLVDTAGLRTSKDELEHAGMARTEKSRELADLLLHMVDRSAPRPEDFVDPDPEKNEIVVLNKSDLSEHADWKNVAGPGISCVTGEGVENLEQEILARIGQQHLQPENALAINARHRDCLRRALEACDRASGALQEGISAEYIAVDLQDALRAVGEVIGAADVEEILDSVFGQFCIGK
jgi:tRNA modification GTPase